MSFHKISHVVTEIPISHRYIQSHSQTNIKTQKKILIKTLKEQKYMTTKKH